MTRNNDNAHSENDTSEPPDIADWAEWYAETDDAYEAADALLEGSETELAIERLAALDAHAPPLKKRNHHGVRD